MLHFTTYNIPETTFRETPLSSKWLWVVVESELSPPEEELLSKICSALKADYVKEVFQLFLSPPANISISSFAEAHPKLIISFGVPPSTLGIWIDLSSPGVRFLETYVFILTAPLNELNSSPTAKKQLWNSMRLFLELK